MREELSQGRNALQQARSELEGARAEAAEQRAAREQLEEELARERDLFRQQLEIADGQLRAEIELQRKAFDEHTQAVERSITELHARLAEARGQMIEEARAEREARLVAEARGPVQPRSASSKRRWRRSPESIKAPTLDPALLRPAGGVPEPTGELSADIDAAAERLRAASVAEEAGEETALTDGSEVEPDREPLPLRELPKGGRGRGCWTLSRGSARRSGERSPRLRRHAPGKRPSPSQEHRDRLRARRGRRLQTLGPHGQRHRRPVARRICLIRQTWRWQARRSRSRR